MSDRVVITGIGVVSSVGTGKEKMWRSLVNGESGISEVMSFDCSDYRVKIGGEVKDFNPGDFLNHEQMSKSGKASWYAYACARMAFEDVALDTDAAGAQRTAVCIGSTMGEAQIVENIDRSVYSDNQKEVSALEYRKFTPSNLTSFLASELSLNGPEYMFFNACASGNYAIGYARDLISLGRADMAVAGGVDVFSEVAFTGFNRLLSLTPDVCRPFDKDRKGLVVSEGAAVLILEKLDAAVGRNAHIYGELKGYGLGTDAYHITSPHPKGEGAAASMNGALKDAGLEPGDIDYICAHGTGTPANDKMESMAIGNVFKDRIPPVSSIKSVMGHAMGAASAIEAAACCLMLEKHIIIPTANFTTPDPDCVPDCVPNTPRKRCLRNIMSNAFAFGGNNSSIILSKVKGC